MTLLKVREMVFKAFENLVFKAYFQILKKIPNNQENQNCQAVIMSIF